MRLLHSLASTHASFDDPDLVSRAGLIPVMALAQRAGVGGLVVGHVRPGGECGVNAYLKIPCLVAGMVAGADSIDDMDLPRHGALPDLFGGIRAPSTLGSHLRSFTWGNVRQLEVVNRLLLGDLDSAEYERSACRRIVARGPDQNMPLWPPAAAAICHAGAYSAASGTRRAFRASGSGRGRRRGGWPCRRSAAAPLCGSRRPP